MPIYNWDISLLLEKLAAEIRSSNFHEAVELVLIDDCSTDLTARDTNEKEAYKHLAAGIKIKYSGLRHNIGRSLIRNKLVEQAAGEFILFLDGDSLPNRPDFLGTYVSYISENRWDVVCGGRNYISRIMYGEEFDFSVYLGNKVEVKSTEIRSETPWRYLYTSNILVRKSVFLKTPFDERFSGYGYEDAEWGIRLGKKYKVLHIDNTVSHLGLVTKETAYAKMQDSIKNYALLAKLHPEAFRESSIYKVTGRLIFLPVSVLDLLAAVSGKLFSSLNNNKISFLFFQFSKAVLCAKQLK